MRWLLIALACVAVSAPALGSDRLGCRVADYGTPDAERVERFVADFERPTSATSLLASPRQRLQVLDGRIRDAALSLADKVAALPKLSPRRYATDGRKELRMQRLILSVAPQDLSLFKLALEYDGDYKDMEEYLFHDIDDEAIRRRILEHVALAPRQNGIKVLSDVDDTLYANLLDNRYPKKTPYPGVLAFYQALKQEPHDTRLTPVTFLSARPNPVAGKLEEDSLQNLIRLTGGKVCPSALSGNIGSSTLGTIESVLRNQFDDALHDVVPDGHEQEIARVKFGNFSTFSRVYPEYRHVFVGDSGQADTLTARLILDATATVITTFIHDIKRSSGSFNGLRAQEKISRTSATGRGVIVFRNYIDAAIIAHVHSKTLGDLITADELAAITRDALVQFKASGFDAGAPATARLQQEYRDDAEEAYRLLTGISRTSSPDVAAIRRLLDQGL